MQLVDLSDEQNPQQPDISKAIVFRTTLTERFVGKGLVLKSDRPELEKYEKESNLYRCLEVVQQRNSQPRIGCTLFTEVQIKSLFENKNLGKVVQLNDGGITQNWCLELSKTDNYWVYPWAPEKFLTDFWGEFSYSNRVQEKPLFSISATITSASVQTQVDADGKPKQVVATQSRMDFSSTTQNDTTYRVATNPSSEFALPLVDTTTQVVIFRFDIEVGDGKASIFPFDAECSCIACAAGTFKAVTGSAACDACVAGKFSTATGQSSSATCQNCLAGTYAALTGSSVCENCLAGKFSPATGQSTAATCQDCLAGKFGSATAQSSCQDCPASSSSAAGSSECFCNPGYWDSYVSCKQCPLGKYRDHLCLTTPCAENTCLACPSGTYAPTPGQSACTKCPVGKAGIST